MSVLKEKCQVIMLPTEHSRLEIDENKLSFECKQYTCKNPQHLYITSSEKLKAGDYCIIDLGEYKRIVRVKNLQGNHPVFSIEIDAGLAKLSSLRKIIATTDCICTGKESDKPGDYKYIPQPSQGFINKFIETYNKGNVITDIIVDYEEFDTLHSDNYKRLKINPKDNTITISPIKDSWNKDEILTFIYELRVTGMIDVVVPIYEFDEYIDNHLN